MMPEDMQRFSDGVTLSAMRKNANITQGRRMMKTAEVLKEHSFLERLVGKWNVTAPEMGGGDDWTETVRSLHGIWFVAEGTGRMPDGKQATTVLTLGYNAEKGKYVGSWIEANFDRCFQLMECDDASLLQDWLLNWSDLVECEIVPVVPSAETKALVEKHL